MVALYCQSSALRGSSACWTLSHSTQPLCGDMASARDEVMSLVAV